MQRNAAISSRITTRATISGNESEIGFDLISTTFVTNSTRLFGLVAFTWVLAAVAVCSVQGQTFLTDGLVGYFPLDGNANDESGNGNNGDLGTVSFVQDRHGLANGAASFAGNSSSRITINTTDFNLPPDFAVSVWVNCTAGVGTEGPRIFSTAGYEIGTDGTSGNRLVSFNNSYFPPTIDNNFDNVWSSSTISAGVWWQIVGVRAGPQMLLYINGQLSGSTEATQAPDYSRGFSPTIGGNSGIGYDNFGGAVDDLRIYNRALSASEVQQLYELELVAVPEPAVWGWATALGLLGVAAMLRR